MTSIFKRNQDGLYAYHDPAGDLIYGVASWIEGQTFVSAQWSITDAGSPSPNLHSGQINGATVTVDDVDYAAGEIASIWITGLTLNQTYTVRVNGLFSSGERDQRSFRLICRNQ